jgi:hypothetical protein
LGFSVFYESTESRYEFRFGLGNLKRLCVPSNRCMGSLINTFPVRPLHSIRVERHQRSSKTVIPLGQFLVSPPPERLKRAKKTRGTLATVLFMPSPENYPPAA